MSHIHTVPVQVLSHTHTVPVQVLSVTGDRFRIAVVGRVKTLQVWPTGAKHADVRDERAFWLWEQLLPADTSATPRVLPTSLWGAVCSSYRPDGHPEGVESGDSSSQTVWPLVSLPPAVIEVAKVLAFTLSPGQSQAFHLPG